ncbi:hypothetical protein V6N11_051915 [Hibiscus sabdariffa]|uniref:Uncharacterized protein n=1 Tax=Hibiscus sabdariffa TaxID=183260 RepID=A0ABR2U992_9ROSI
MRSDHGINPANREQAQQQESQGGQSVNPTIGGQTHPATKFRRKRNHDDGWKGEMSNDGQEHSALLHRVWKPDDDQSEG